MSDENVFGLLINNLSAVYQYQIRKVILFSLISILSFKSGLADETKMIKVTLVRKSVKALVNGKEIFPTLDDELPLTAKIECDKMGFLEFEYAGNTYRINKETKILISDVVASAGNRNFQSTGKTDVSGVRGRPEKEKKKSKKKKKLIKEKD